MLSQSLKSEQHSLEPYDQKLLHHFQKKHPHIRLSGGKDRKRESARHTCLFIFNQEG